LPAHVIPAANVIKIPQLFIAVILTLPFLALNTAVICNSIYGKKFYHWHMAVNLNTAVICNSILSLPPYAIVIKLFTMVIYSRSKVITAVIAVMLFYNTE
jgi:hypothetical protein